MTARNVVDEDRRSEKTQGAEDARRSEDARKIHQRGPPRESADRARYEPSKHDALVSRVRELEVEAERLRRRGKEAVFQRDKAEARAIAAEAKIADVSPGRDRRFDELRRVLARELHPDHAEADGIEKLVRAEIFKTLWPQIERIGK